MSDNLFELYLGIDLTSKPIDKVMKPYWDSKFSCSKLEKFETYSMRWCGFIKNKEKLVSCRIDTISSQDTWFYNVRCFEGGQDMFNLTRIEFLSAMGRYLIKTYNVNIKYML